MRSYYIISYKELFETTNLLDASKEVKERLKKDKDVIVIKGNLVKGERFLENVRRLYR